MKAALTSGRELGSSARTGPALMGLIVMTPSIPVSEPARVWPGKKTAHMIRPGRAIENLRNRIGKFTLTPSYQSIMTKPRKHRPTARTSRGLYAAKPEWRMTKEARNNQNSPGHCFLAFRSFLRHQTLVIHHCLASSLSEPALLAFPWSFRCLPLTTDSLHRNFSLSARNL
jgi:hypothetical protein